MNYKGVIDKIILLKLTTRQRPQQAANCINTALSLANNTSRIKILTSIDFDDDSIYDLPGDIRIGTSLYKIHAINRDIPTDGWDILVNLSDDQTCITQGWDSIIREAMPNNLDYSLWFYDGAQPRINTMEIVGRNYYHRSGSVYHPDYKSFYCDEEATNVGLALGKLIKSDQILFRHDHPACHHTTSLRHDGLYERNQLAWDEDKATFERRRSMNYGL